MAPVIRGADIDQHSLAGHASVLWAIAGGMAYNIKDDQELHKTCMVIYDALYTWTKNLQNVRHTESRLKRILHLKISDV